MSLESQIALQVAEKIRDAATKQGRIPFKTGDLRKSIQASLVRQGVATVGSNLSYARAVHDGRGPVTIRPNIDKNPPRGERKKYHSKAWYQQHPERARLKFKIGNRVVYAKEVRQPARKGQPFLTEGLREVQREGFEFLYPLLRDNLNKKIARHIVDTIKIDLL